MSPWPRYLPLLPAHIEKGHLSLLLLLLAWGWACSSSPDDFLNLLQCWWPHVELDGVFWSHQNQSVSQVLVPLSIAVGVVKARWSLFLLWPVWGDSWLAPPVLKTGLPSTQLHISFRLSLRRGYWSPNGKLLFTHSSAGRSGQEEMAGAIHCLTMS